MTRAQASGIRLTAEKAAVVKGMIARGDRQHDIAAWFGVNGGRIGEIATGRNFASVPAQHTLLPPAGPYMSGKSSVAAKKTLTKVKKELEVAMASNNNGNIKNIITTEVDRITSMLKNL